MKIILILALLVSAAGVSAVQDQKPNKRIQVNYDKFKDITTVRLGPYFMSGGMEMALTGGQFQMLAAFRYAGRGLTVQPLEIVLAFLSESKDWRFMESRDLYAIVDGERVSLGRADRRSDVKRRGVTEEMTIALPFSMFEKIANAKEVQMRLGYREFDLKDEHLKGFRDLISMMTPYAIPKN